MFYLDIKRVMRVRGIEKHFNLLIKLGFVPSTARSFLDGTTRQVKLDQLEQLCIALNCTPNDLLEWRPDANQSIAETHSLNVLRKKTEKDLPNLLGEIPMEKFDQILGLLQDLKDK